VRVAEKSDLQIVSLEQPPIGSEDGDYDSMQKPIVKAVVMSARELVSDYADA
jgi:hypothetical protein